MNTKIFNLIIKNLESAFNLPKYESVLKTLGKDTRIDFLPWTPARFEKFKYYIDSQLDLNIEYTGTVEELTIKLDDMYMARFFSELWRPNTDVYVYSGWSLADEINKQNPKAVLDVGCGYNQFKNRIENLVGIDPYNNCADYMVSINDYNVDEKYDHMLVLGSINFNELSDIEQKFSKCCSLLAENGKIYVRANPGHQWKTGPWVEIFPWSFEHANNIAKKFNLKLLTFKKDNNDRLFFVYQK
jgi:hypothetical protein